MEMPERTLAHAEHDANGFVFECVIERDITFVVLRLSVADMHRKLSLVTRPQR